MFYTILRIQIILRKMLKTKALQNGFIGIIALIVIALALLLGIAENYTLNVSQNKINQRRRGNRRNLKY